MTETPPKDSVDSCIIASATAALDTLIGPCSPATSSDPDLVSLMELIESGLPDRDMLPQQLRVYHQFRSSLYTADGVILYKDRIVIPVALHQDVLLALHSAHQGVTAMTARAEIPLPLQISLRHAPCACIATA